ncbi:hypothetical protein TanjilG_28817 [Lupinus angustifolius]|uniref:THAP4-like heme-binding domain-containing protein n=1 Tax=Lupinus angustifolius TaxID=3871 RepID=A0A4P1R9N6_LUPAN|nr:hypothetical protein TanjilG_28817 [Lupinus angustifolius]
MDANIDSPASESSSPPVLHPALAPLSFLLGTWRGQGEGGYPTIHSFSYGEELHFSHLPNKPVIGYTQKTWKLSSGEPMHAESGYWRPKPDGTIEVVIAQSTGLIEVQACGKPCSLNERTSPPPPPQLDSTKEMVVLKLYEILNQQNPWFSIWRPLKLNYNNRTSYAGLFVYEDYRMNKF